ncbi:histone H3.v1 [Seriola aureovittata]|uniref:histone H3.v1 n=1 Tax=Seriola aureovittata TaxID=2871759 RepID=UPI0024BEC3A7|nr:histone H3.v1 [Seriola aureovittata]XP_056246243.1 histone H3.v1 [Seriola aureovittata]XP_056246244.1 histone H3.v1 [Seriola aureovittata]
MDVSIAVSLIRGQMGTVVERAVNGAVETVLAEMLKVVGVKFEELKAQVALMKRDITALQREKALKEKENDNIRAKLRYTELKLKYYRQGVEEELQQRASTSTLVRIHPSSFPQTQRGGSGHTSTETSPSCSAQTRTTEAALTRSSQVLFNPKERDTAESVDAAVAPPPVLALTLDLEKQTATGPMSPDGSTQADSSTLPSSALQVKQEAQQLQQEEEEDEEDEEEEEEEVICIKGEPEEEQEVMATLLLDCQVQQGHLSESEAQSSVTEWSGLPAGQRSHSTTFSSAGPSTYLMLQPTASLPSMVALPSGIPPHQGVRPWTKDLYEEYKLRRNELRRRSLNRRRELEKSLPQPLLADMVRERREKTRLRVARWRAKRKLQARLNQAQAESGAAGLCQTGFPISSQHQDQLRAAGASTSSSHQRQHSSSFLNNNSISATVPFITSSSSTSSVLLRGPSMATHQHAVTSTSSSSSSYPQVSLSQQSICLTDTDILQ